MVLRVVRPFVVVDLGFVVFVVFEEIFVEELGGYCEKGKEY